MRAWSIRAGFLLVAAAAAPAVVPGCSCEDTGSATTEGTGGNTGQGGSGQGGCLFNCGSGGSGAQQGCVNLECQQVQCGGGTTTTVTGVVYEPAGNVPLYNVTVYVPNSPLNEIVDGASCDQCSATLSGDPVVATLTDTQGRFTLTDVPVGANIPLVIQVGKWRREFVIPTVTECVDNPTIDGEIRLPRNSTEGHLPLMALTTGGADPLECLLRKIGIDDAEFTPEGGAGRVHLFTGVNGTSSFDSTLNNGAALTDATALWGTMESLMRYDVVLMACEGSQNPNTKPAEALQAMHDYASAGGRIFASHWHNYWMMEGPDPWPVTATWDFQNDPPSPFRGLINETFPKGQAFSEWMVNVQGSVVPGEIQINAAQHTVATVDETLTTRWIYSEAPEVPGVQYFTYNTPLTVPEEEQCGRVVYTDIHVSSGDDVDRPFPTGCTTQDLSPQEKALLFMLFDLSACVTPDDEPPPPPDIQ